MNTQSTLVSAEELLHVFGEGRRYELVEGELIETVPACGLHGRIANTTAFILTSYVRPRKLGVVFAAETGFLLARDPDTVRAPDAAFVAAERLPEEGLLPGCLEMAPDLAVEVISHSDSASHIQSKVETWLAAGTRLVWVVYPESRSVVAYRSLREAAVLSTDDTLDAAPVFEDFSVTVGERFS